MTTPPTPPKPLPPSARACIRALSDVGYPVPHEAFHEADLAELVAARLVEHTEGGVAITPAGRAALREMEEEE